MKHIKRYEFTPADVKQALHEFAAQRDETLDLAHPAVLFLDDEEVTELALTIEVGVGEGEMSYRAWEAEQMAKTKFCTECLPIFDPAVTKGIDSHIVREHFPRFDGSKTPCSACGYRGIRYASEEHKIAGGW